MMTVQIIKRMWKIACVCIAFVLFMYAADCVAQDVKNDPFNSKTGGVIFNFPEDHKLHNGPVMKDENFQEWLYWTGFPKDPDDGAQLAIFVNLFRAYEKGAFSHRYALTIFRLNKDGSQLAPSVNLALDNLSASSGRTKDGKDTFVQYKGKGISITYLTDADTWHVTADNQKEGKDRVALDLTFKPTSRGYVAESPSGIAYQGVPSSKTAAYDQMNLRCLSYYYSAPRNTETGSLTLAGRTIKVNDSTGWFDHQWGGFSHGCHAYNYNWLGARLDNGDAFMLRDWHDPIRQSNPQFRRLAFFPKEGPPRYWQGVGAFELTEVDYYIDEDSKKTWGLKYNLTTPEGNFRLEPIFYDDQYPYDYWEGGMWIRKLNPDGTAGDSIGVAFLEQSQTYR